MVYSISQCDNMFILQKVRLIGFEQNFDIKVQEIDDKYKAQMHELMTQNTELK